MKRWLMIGLVVVALGGVLAACVTTPEEGIPQEEVAPTPQEEPPLTINASIKIEATASTWREGEQPYDIYSAIKQKLEKVGFEVVPQESMVYDATLVIDYSENKGRGYSITGLGPTAGYGTNITCILKLDAKTRGLIFEKRISASTSYKSSALYWDAVDDFEDAVYFKYLGGFIATKFGVGDGVSVLILALEDEDIDTQCEAVEALGEIGDERAVEPLIQALKDENWHVRWDAAEALGEIGDERAVEPLIQALKDEDRRFRLEALEALGEIGDERAVEPLIQALKDEDKAIRYWAAKALGEIGDERAVDSLTQALQDEVEYVRDAAEEALEKIRGY